jgi:hypothetical protein
MHKPDARRARRQYVIDCLKAILRDAMYLSRTIAKAIAASGGRAKRDP